jgi:hypothetical protein
MYRACSCRSLSHSARLGKVFKNHLIYRIAPSAAFKNSSSGVSDRDGKFETIVGLIPEFTIR